MNMSVKKIVLLSLAVVLVACAAFIFVTAKKNYTPTQGARISRYADPKKALLIIDVQADYTGIDGKKIPLLKGVENQIANINRLIDMAAASGMEVVYIRQLFDNNLRLHGFLSGGLLKACPAPSLIRGSG